MLGTGGRVRDVVAALLARPDEIMLEIGAGGELMVARLRVVIADLVPQRHVIRNARYFTESTRYPEDYFRGRIRGRVWDISNPIPDEFFAVDPVREVVQVEPDVGLSLQPDTEIPERSG